MNIPGLISKIDQWIRVLLYIFIFFLPFSKGVVETTVVASCLLWIIKHTLLFGLKGPSCRSLEDMLRNFWEAYRPPTSPLNLGIAFFLCAGIISIFGSPLPMQSLRGFLTKTLEWFAIYGLTIEVFVSRKHIENAFKLFILSAVIVGLDTLAQSYWLHKDLFTRHALTEGYRATATFSHPNLLGAFLAMAIPISLGVFLNVRRVRVQRILFGALALLLIWSLYLTFSRGAWIGATIGILFFAIVIVYPHIQKRLLYVLVTLALTVSVFAVGQSFELKKRHNPLKNDSATLEFRYALWREGIFLIKERPFFGHGLNTFMPVMEKAVLRDKGPLAFGYNASYAHNCYLQIAAETGIIGLSAFLGILILLFKQILSLGRMEYFAEPLERYVAIGTLAGLLAFLAHSFVDINFYSLQLPDLFWFMAGLLISFDKLLRNRNGYGIS